MERRKYAEHQTGHDGDSDREKKHARIYGDFGFACERERRDEQLQPLHHAVADALAVGASMHVGKEHAAARKADEEVIHRNSA